ncbi:MAG: hypothetical protein AB1568_04645 [Thermodesulfobacteriota bacterium]
MSVIPDDDLPQSPAELPGDLGEIAAIIARVVGCERTAARCAWEIACAYRGVAIHIRTGDELRRAWRDRAIRKMFDRRTAAGETANAVVRDCALTDWPTGRISERRVWEILGMPDERQMRLF